MLPGSVCVGLSGPGDRVGQDGRLGWRMGQTFPNAPLPTTLSSLKWKRETSPSKSIGCERQQTAPMVWWRERRRMDLGQQPWSDHQTVQELPAPPLFLALFQFSLKHPPAGFEETTHASLRLPITAHPRGMRPSRTARHHGLPNFSRSHLRRLLLVRPLASIHHLPPDNSL